MNSMWSQLWHGYSRVLKGLEDAILVMDKKSYAEVDMLCLTNWSTVV